MRRSGRYKVKTDDTLAKSTTSTTFVDVPNGAMGISVSGTTNSCVIVSFSSNAYAADSLGAILFVQALLDGSAVANPGEVQFAASDGTYNFAKSFDFIFPSVTPGAHTVKMQFRSFFSGDTVFINKHTIVVQFR